MTEKWVRVDLSELTLSCRLILSLLLMIPGEVLELKKNDIDYFMKIWRKRGVLGDFVLI